MSPQRPIVPFITGSLLALACVAFLFGGPLNPPSGPVSAGGKTTQEIFDAVTANSSATGSIGGRGPAVPGSDFTGGSFTMNTMPAASGAILGMRATWKTPDSEGISMPPTSTMSIYPSFTIVRNMGASDVGVYKALTSGLPIGSATITVPSTNGNMVYTLTGVLVTGLRHVNIQRADGTFAAVEEIDVIPQAVKIDDPNNGHYQYNWVTHSGTSG